MPNTNYSDTNKYKYRYDSIIVKVIAQEAIIKTKVVVHYIVS